MHVSHVPANDGDADDSAPKVTGISLMVSARHPCVPCADHLSSCPGDSESMARGSATRHPLPEFTSSSINVYAPDRAFKAHVSFLSSNEMSAAGQALLHLLWVWSIKMSREPKGLLFQATVQTVCGVNSSSRQQSRLYVVSNIERDGCADIYACAWSLEPSKELKAELVIISCQHCV